jgi:pimeloyl-ACP methyl ester carboxylesterase
VQISGTGSVAARAPDAGEDFVALSGKFPAGPVRAGIQQHDGFTTISEEAFLKSFANGVVHTKAEVLYAVQEPTAASLFGERTTTAAWHSKPSWYAVSKLDQTINPDLERFLAKRMNATTVEVEAGHLSLVSHPKEIADLILAAAGRREWPTSVRRACRNDGRWRPKDNRSPRPGRSCHLPSTRMRSATIDIRIAVSQ